MEKKKGLFVSLGIILLTTSCSSTIAAETIDPSTLKESVKSLTSDGDASYYHYYNALNEKYGTDYVASSNKKELMPEGVALDTTYVQAGNAPDYACTLLSSTAGGVATYRVDSPLKQSAQGRYTLKLEYYIPETFVSNAMISIKVNGVSLFEETSAVTLPLRYSDDVTYLEDGSKNFDSYTTRYGDQMYPNQKRVMEWQNEDLYAGTYETTSPLIFDFSSSLNTQQPIISITNASDEYFFVGKLTLLPYEEKQSYATYLASVNQTKGAANIALNAVSYAYKNNNEARLSTEQTPTVSPYDSKRKLLNVVYSWEEAGQSITWEVDVESAGLYPLTFHYYNGADNFPIYRNIKIDNEVLYKELNSYRFPTTGSSYANETLKDENGRDMYVYFTAGKHTITLTSTTESTLEVYKNLMAVYDSINDLAIQIRQITGANVDSNRTYKITDYIEGIEETLQAYRTIIYDSYNKVKALVGNEDSSSSLSYFTRMSDLIEEFIKEPDDLPLNLAKFSSGDSCLAKLVADTASTLQASPMILDMIYLTNDTTFIPRANASWTSTFNDSLVNLGLTFSSDKYKTELVDGELNIWSARSQAYNDILQAMADNYFTPNTKCAEFPDGIKVNIRQMPSEDNLIYAYAAGTVPDLALGINSGRAYEFALRGDAAYPMSDFDNSWKYTNNNYWDFSPYYWDAAKDVPYGQLMSMLYNDKFYSFPESTSVQLMFIRDDIMNVMGDQGGVLDAPNTWQDLIGILPRLQSYGTNFYYPVSASGSLKSLSGTAQFILQEGGSILSSDGYSTNLRSDETYEALKLLTNLYTIYSLPTEVASFYNSFRYGTMPVGIGDLGMYLQLKYVAPELSGKWSVDVIPGIAQEANADGSYDDLNGDGVGDEVSRWYISNGSAGMIFNNSKMIDEAWLFMQWWMSTSVQVEFSNSLISTFGPSVLWHSANKQAAKELPIESSVRDIVNEQANWIIDLQQIPGQYMLQRGLSDIWNTVVFGTSSDGSSTGKVTIGNAIDLQKVVMDREVQRKMEEFGYYNQSTGTSTKPYLLRDFNWVVEQFKTKATR